MTRATILIASIALLTAACAPQDEGYSKEATAAPPEKAAETREPDVVFVPTPDAVVEQMLTMAKVVTLYLLDSLNLKLRPILLEHLRPGARVVSQSFDMGDWEPEQQTEVADKQVYLWTIPRQQTAEAR